MKSYKEVLGKIMAPVMTGKQALFAAVVTEHGQYMAGLKSELFYNDADVHVEVCCLIAEYYGLIASTSWDYYNFEAEAMGQRTKYAAAGLPDIDQTDPLIKSEADLDKIKWPGNPLKSGRVPVYVRSLELMEKYTGMPTTLWLAACSPFSIACGICSYAGLMGFIKHKPELAHEILRRIVDDITVPYLKAIAEKYPGIMVKFADAWEMVPNVSPKIQQEYAFQYYDRVIEAAKDINVDVSWYCAYSEKNFPDPAAYLADKLKYAREIMITGTETDVVPVSVYRDVAIEKSVPLTVNVPADRIFDGPPEAIVEFVRQLAKESRPGVAQYSMAALVPYSAPPEHVAAVVAAGKAFCALPVPEDFDAIKVEIPELKESFGDFVRRKHKENPDGYTFKWLDKAKFYGE